MPQIKEYHATKIHKRVNSAIGGKFINFSPCLMNHTFSIKTAKINMGVPFFMIMIVVILNHVTKSEETTYSADK